MDWRQVQTIVRLWSMRPWLYKWSIDTLDQPDKMVDDRWQRWFKEINIIKRSNDTHHSELDDDEMGLVKKMYKIYTIVLCNESALKVEDLAEIKMLVYRQSTIGNWLKELTSSVMKIPAIRLWVNQVPLLENRDILLLVFVCYNYSMLLQCYRNDGNITTLHNLMFSESTAINAQREEGNQMFRRGTFEEAVAKYTDALNQMTYNQKLYSNRAAAHLRLKSARAAACDGLRSLHINPMWDRGWERYVNGLIDMGLILEAWQMNQVALATVEDHAILLKQADEIMQYDDVVKIKGAKGDVNMFDFMGMGVIDKPYTIIQSVYMSRSFSTMTSSVEDLPGLVSDSEDASTQTNHTKANRVHSAKDSHSSRQSGARRDSLSNSNNILAVKRDSSRTRKKDRATSVISNSSSNINNNNNVKCANSTSNMPMKGSRIRDLLEQGTTAWLDKRMSKAVRTYIEALELLTPAVQKEMGYSDREIAVVLYTLGQSNISHISAEKDVHDGLDNFYKILERYPHLTFPLAYLGIGMAYLKWNRFKMAVDPLQKGLRITKKQASMPVYEWPESNKCIEESKKDKLIERLECLLVECNRPPKPTAICRYYECSHYELRIYPDDPDFKGFVELRCYEQCIVAYHLDCWRKSKSASDKDILSGRCFTPNCNAPLSRLITYDHTKEIISEKDNKIQPKEPGVRKAATKMKPTSQNTINRRLEKKQRRKVKKAEEKTKQNEASKLVELLNYVEVAAIKNEQVKAPNVDLLTCKRIMPKREEENREEEAKKQRKKRRPQKEQRTVVRLDIIGSEGSGDAGTVEVKENIVAVGAFGGLDDFDEVERFPNLNPVAPFAVPAHIVAETSYLEAAQPTVVKPPPIPSRPSTPVVVLNEVVEREKDIFEANNRQALRESLFQLFKGILQDSGPVHIDDARIISQLAGFPTETLNIIDAEGGIGSFLKKSITFTIIDDIVGLIKDSTKIRKVANKRKAQLRKAASNNRSKKSETVAEASHVSTSEESAKKVAEAFKAPAAVAASKSTIDVTSDLESIASSDTCSESFDIISNSSSKNKTSSVASSSGGAISGKTSPWLRTPSVSADNLQTTMTDVQMTDVEVMNMYRLGANRLRVAVELGRLACMLNLRLGVEVRLLYGWEHTGGMEHLNSATIAQAVILLKDALDVVTASSGVVYSCLGAEVYFFGVGKNSVDEEHANWVMGPEVGLNTSIRIAMSLDHVNMKEIVVNTNQLDQASVDTLNAISNAADTVRGITDGFKSGLVAQMAVRPIFTTMGQRVAVDDVKTHVLLQDETYGKSPPVAPPVAPPVVQALRVNCSLMSQAPPGLQSPIARPSTSTARSHDANKPLVQVPTSFSSSVQPLMSLPTLPMFSPGSINSTGLTTIWDTGLGGSSASGLSSPLYGYSSPKVSGTNEQITATMQMLHTKVIEDSGTITTLMEKNARLQEQLRVISKESDKYRAQESSLITLGQALTEKTKELASVSETAQQMQISLTTTNDKLVKQIQEMCISTEQEMMKSEMQKDELRGKVHREVSLRVATESQYVDMLAKESKRAQNAETAVLQLKLQVGLQIIDRSAHEAELVIKKINDDAKKYSDQFMAVPGNYKTATEKLKGAINDMLVTRDTAIKMFEEQKNLVKSGTHLETLPNLDVPRPPPAPEIPILQPAPALLQPHPRSVSDNHRATTSLHDLHSTATKSSSVTSMGLSSYTAAAAHTTRMCQSMTAAAAAHTTRLSQSMTTAATTSIPVTAAASAPAQQPLTAAAAVASRLAASSASRLTGFSAVAAAPAVKQVPAASPATVRVTKVRNSFERIVDQIQLKFPQFDRPKISSFLQQVRESRGGTLSRMKIESVLSSVESCIHKHQKSIESIAGISSFGSSMDSGLEEDPCTICLDELLPGSTEELDCRHRFHATCIRQWLREKSTCPNCNKHALLTDEFPILGSF